MFSAQRINPSLALLWLPLDSSFVAAGITWTRNVAPKGPDAASVTFDSVSAAITLDSAFTICVTTSADLRYSGTLASNLSGGIGVRFYTTGSGVLIGSISDSSGVTISVTGTLPLTRSPRQISLSYDGSGNSLGLQLMVNGVPISSVPSGGPLVGSIDSGAEVVFGQGLGTNVMYRIAVYPYALGSPELRLLRSRPLQRTAQSIVNVWSIADTLGANGIWFVGNEGIGFHTQPNLIDGNMEAAGTASWLAANATLSKQGDPYAGLRCLRVAHPGTFNYFWASQQLCIVGCRYAAQFAARGDGTAKPAWTVRPVLPLTWQAPSGANTWVIYSADGTANTDRSYFGADGFVSGYVEFDNLTIQNISVSSHTPKAATGALSGKMLVQATPTNMPWKSSSVISYGEDTLHRFTTMVHDDILNFGGGEWFVMLGVKLKATLPGFRSPIGHSDTFTGWRCFIRSDNTLGTNYGNNAEFWPADTVVLANDVWHVLGWGRDINGRVYHTDGTTRRTAGALPSITNINSSLSVGGGQFYIANPISDIFITVGRCPDDTTITKMYAAMLSRIPI